MSQPEIIPMSAVFATASDQEIDLGAVHHMEFWRNRQWIGLAALLQSALMAISGAFLLSQIPVTPRLALQITIVGLLLAGGSMFLGLNALRDLRGFLRMDAHGLAARLGLRQVRILWDEVTKWRINDIARSPVLSAVEVWTKSSPDALCVPGGMISPSELHRVRILLNAYAAGKESPDTIDYRPQQSKGLLSRLTRFARKRRNAFRTDGQMPPDSAS